MGLIGYALVAVLILWVTDRLWRGAKATPLREREDAKKVAGVGKGLGEALPFLGQPGLDLPAPPPPSAYEPDGANTITMPEPDEEPR